MENFNKEEAQRIKNIIDLVMEKGNKSILDFFGDFWLIYLISGLPILFVIFWLICDLRWWTSFLLGIVLYVAILIVWNFYGMSVERAAKIFKKHFSKNNNDRELALKKLFEIKSDLALNIIIQLGHSGIASNTLINECEKELLRNMEIRKKHKVCYSCRSEIFSPLQQQQKKQFLSTSGNPGLIDDILDDKIGYLCTVCGLTYCAKCLDNNGEKVCPKKCKGSFINISPFQEDDQIIQPKMSDIKDPVIEKLASKLKQKGYTDEDLDHALDFAKKVAQDRFESENKE